MTIKIAQGEKYYFDRNLYLGELTVPVKSAPKGREGARVRFTYDINGIIQVDVTVLSTGVTKSKMIINKSIRLSDEELQEKLKALNKIKIHPRDAEENKLLLARAEALFEEATGVLREDIAMKQEMFANTLAAQDPRRIRRAQEDFSKYLDMVEQYFENPFGFDR